MPRLVIRYPSKKILCSVFLRKRLVMLTFFPQLCVEGSTKVIHSKLYKEAFLAQKRSTKKQKCTDIHFLSADPTI